MNTKTTKFLAVLAVFAMAFAGFAVLTTAEQGDATDPVVDEITLSGYPGSLAVTVSGSSAEIVGTAAATGIPTDYEQLTPATNEVFNGMTLAIPPSLKITKIVVTDNAFNSLKLKTSTSYDKIDGNVRTIVKASASYLTSVVVPVPTDGSAVGVMLYAGEDFKTEVKDITLDFARTYTQITLNTDAAHSYAAAEPYGWAYTTGKVLTLTDYTGNNIFKLPANAQVVVKGTNVLGMEVAPKKTGIESTLYSAIYGAGNLTIKTSGATPAAGCVDELDIRVNIGEKCTSETEACVAGIYSNAGNLNMSEFVGTLVIDIDGSISSDKSITSVGIYNKAEFTLGTSASIPATVDISVSPEDGSAIAIEAGATSTIYIDGAIEGGNRAVDGTGGSNSTFELGGNKLVLSGSEAAIKLYSKTNTLNVTNLQLNLSGKQQYNTGDNGFYALTVKDGATTKFQVGAGCTVTTDGMLVEKKINTFTNDGIIVINGDYAANPDSKVMPHISGLYWAPTDDELTVYNEVPAGETKYILLGDKCETFGLITVMNKSGTVVEKTVTNIANITTANLSAWAAEGVTKVNVINAEGTVASEITVPNAMTLSINYTAVAGVAHTIACNGKSFQVYTDFKGIIVVDKDGLEIQKFEAGNLKDVKTNVTISGDITAGTITGDDYASTITFVDTTNISATGFTIQANQAKIVVDSDATLNLTGDLNIAKKVGTTKKTEMTINGSLVQKDASATLSIALGDLTVNGSVTGINEDDKLAITLAADTTATFNGVLGAYDGTTAKKAVVGIDANKEITVINVTGGFKLSASTTDLTISGTISRAVAKNAKICFDAVKTTGLTISKYVAADTAGEAGDLTAAGPVVIEGTFDSSTAGELTLAASSSLKGAGYVKGTITVGGANITFPAQDTYDLTYLTGYSFAVDADNKATISGTLAPSASSTEAWTLTVASGALYTNSLALSKNVTFSITVGASVIGAVNGPSGEKVTLNATANTADLTLTGGSLIVSGGFIDKDDSAKGIIVSAGTVTIGKDADVDEFLTIGATGNLEVANGAIADVAVTNGLAFTAGGKVTLDSGSKLTNAAKVSQTNLSINVASGAETDSFVTGAKYANGATMQYTVKNAADALTGKTVRVVFVTPTGSEKQYAIGAILYNYTGTGVSPVTTDNLKYYAVEATNMGGTDSNIATAGALTGATISDAIGIYKDAITVTFAGYTEKAPIEVIGAAIEVEINIEAADDHADDFADKTAMKKAGWTFDEGKTATKTYYIGDKTTTFGILATAIDTTGKYVLDHYGLKGQTGSTFDPSVSVYTYTNQFAQTKVTLEPVMKDITKTTYTVKFDSNGGSAVADQTVAYKKTVTKPTDPTLSGKNFAGWYSDAKLTTKYNFKSLVTADMTLYAKWEAAEPTATSVDVAVSKVTGGVKVTVAGEGDLAVPAGKITVKYWYWVNLSVGKVIAQDSATETVKLSGIVNTNTVTIDQTPVYVVVSYVSDDGSVTAQTPYVFF